MYVCLFTILNIIIFIYYYYSDYFQSFYFPFRLTNTTVLFFGSDSFRSVCAMLYLAVVLVLNHHQHKEIFQVKPFWCHECAKTFSSQSKLKQHMLIHSEEKPYMCDICERAFNVVSNLRRHLRTVHKETLAPSLELSAPRIRV